MTQTNPHTRRSRCRDALMMSCASAALATAALFPQAARAQAFQGSITSSTGSVTRSTPTSTTETLTIGTNTATINWSPSNQQQGGPPINFLPAGNTATFTSAPGVTDYTVLNRILPDSGQAIALNGNVISTLQGTSTTGGHVWFYAPGGIVVGATAVFNVGGLLLTTNDVTSFGTSANGFNASFSGTSGSTSVIQIQNGAQINALQPGSYVAMIAPRIEQGGTVHVNGSAAYVAAEQATLTVNQGLFDIQVDVGTSDSDGVVHTGETSGAANTTAADNHGIYMVAVPKNQALTMLLSGGRIGFGDAVSADVQNGQIVLSAGYSVSHDDSGNAFMIGFELGDSIGGQPAGITITGGKYSSSVQGAATGDILAKGGGGALEFDGNLNLQALGSSTLLADSGDTITVGGSANISANDLKYVPAENVETNVDAYGGFASIQANTGGSISIAGDTTVSAMALGAANLAANTRGVSNGGTASIAADGGSISIGGTANVLAIAQSSTTSDGIDGSDSYGGTAQVSAMNGGSINFAGTLMVNADGDGSFSALTSGGRGGDGIGGYASLTSDSNAAIHVGGGTIASATGYGGGIITSLDGTNGTGEGGEADVGATNGGSISIAGDLGVSGRGFGNPYGNPALQVALQGGEGDGGSTDLFLDGGSISVAGNAWFGADGLGGAGQTGGTGYGGSATAEIAGGEGFSQGGNLNVTGALTLQAEGVGGAGADNSAGTGGQGGDGYGGYASFYVTPDFIEGATANVSLGGLSVSGDATGGNGGSGITGGNGGNAYAGYYGGGDCSECGGYYGSSTFEMFGGTATVGNMFVTADASGGNGGAASGGAGGAGGTGQGGDASIELSNASLSAQHVSGAARGFGGNGGSSTNGAGGDGGSGQGGTFGLYVDAGGTLSADWYVAYGNGIGGNAGTGTSGSTTGGAGQSGYDSAYIDGVVTVTGNSANANGFVVTSFASGGTGDTGGSATAGGSSITVNGSLTSGGLVQATAQAGGGNGVTTGGSADGGSSAVNVNGHLTTDTLTMLTNAFAGSGASAGGDASAGSTSLFLSGGTASVTTSGHIEAKATAGNASAGSGGFATGGNIEMEAFDGSSINGGSLSIDASAIGGSGNVAGAGQAGSAFIDAQTLYSDAPASIALQQLSLTANGTTGGGAAGGEIVSSGGPLGILAAGSTISIGAVTMTANGTNSGGFDAIQLDTDSSGTAATIQFGSLNAQANGGDAGGQIFVSSASGGSLDLGEATLQATGASGGSITLLTGYCLECGSGGGEASLGQSPLPAAGGITASDLTLNTSGDIFVGLSGGADVSVAGTLNGTAGGTITLLDQGGGGAIRAHEIDLSANSINDSADIIADIIRFASASEMELGNLSATDTIDLSSGEGLITGDLHAGDISLDSSGDLAFGNVTGDRLSFDASGSVTGGNIAVTNRVGGSAAGPITLGDISAGPSLPSGNDFSVGISSLSSITVGDVTGAGHVGFATLGNLTTGDLTAGDLVMLLVGGDVDTGAITTASNGRVYIANASMFATGGGGEGEGDHFDPNVVLATAPVATGGAITINGPVTTGRMQAAAGGNLTVDDITAATDVTLSAGGLATFNGTVRSPTITVTSGDIDVTEGASLGVSGVTNLLTLNAISHGLPIIIGDNGSQGGNVTGQYQLNEDGDLRATNIVINAQGAVSGFNPDVQVFDVNIEGGSTSNVTLNTGGSVLVKGKVSFVDATPTDSLTINAGHVIEVNTDTGGIQITDNSNALTGILNLNADNIWVASGSVLSQLEGDVNFAGRNAALATNSGTANQDGFVRAGTINAGVADTFLVQNSGTPDLFGGIDTGAGGLAINSTGTSPATLIVYGRQTQANGTVITNQDFLGSVDVTGTGGFTTDSSVNGCAIGGTCGQTTTPPGIDMASILGPLDETNSPSDEDKKKKDKEGDESDDGSSADPSLRLINTTPINNAPPIEEPVTSGGDVVVGGGPVQPN